ncbi:uncharacterized protein [Drosophila kikkawai]|uniref:Coiled-coil domain-containing protein 181 n=1 Tax=Drosophila kikkawai TaxID=30033 RepID=A0A6P4IK31_DROKI|nr:uncharacterized protein LOC108075265 [Drosophila kikkawai]
MCPQLAEMGEREPESDGEDAEVYFLKPVNEYNIVDRIKEANKELFALEEEGAGAGAGVNGNGKVTKVKFALNLEDYEPTGGPPGKDQSPSPPDELLQQLTQLKLKTIAEEETVTSPEASKIVEKETPPSPVEEEVEEEICEEILDLTEVSPPPVVQEALAIPEEDEDDFSGVDETDLDDVKDASVAAPFQVRQISNFDQDDSDQKSLTNLLTESDCEEEERTLIEARQKLRDAYKSLYKTLDPKEQATIDRLTGVGVPEEEPFVQPLPVAAAAVAPEPDEEDDLSIIVASYIPDNFELNEQSIYYKKEEPEDLTRLAKQQSCSECPKATSKSFFTSRSFSFRRRSKPTPTPSSATASTSQTSPSIRMNYKICCEHRHSLQGKLPRYTGYMSEYGLSAQQLQRREQQLRRKQRFSMEQTINRNEQELKKMQDNERAFTTWLKNKMRYPINKTRNMFDAHKRRGSVAAVAGSPHTHQQEQQPHRGGSRRRRRRHDSGDEEVVHAYRHLLGSWNK